MSARIYRPSKTAMQSGTRNTRHWFLEFEPEKGKTLDPLMGWVGSADTKGQVRLKFDTLEEAESYAKRMGLEYTVAPDHSRKRNIQAYADNFKYTA
ncbi:ETC complex I subunit [Pseudokordiimonas caeni]|uniref:ETC complex I subunit n=1 Tax=Pseudokordiimonas caeni TaxID=2997908 RepID=UPI00281102F6|nr:ETC complex I subunit [Pseudokordiimonas caeni]